MSDEERARKERLASPVLQTRFLCFHVALRLILARYLKVDASDLLFLRGKHGKPRLPVPHDLWNFNLSHSEDHGLIALTRGGEVGVDIERIRPTTDVTGLARRFFAPSECETLLSWEGDTRIHAFFRLWVRKEACVKAAGWGLAHQLSRLCIPADGGDGGDVTWVANPDHPSIGWWVHGRQPHPGFEAAVAVSFPDPDITWIPEDRIAETVLAPL